MLVHEELMDSSRPIQKYKSGYPVYKLICCMLALKKMHLAWKRKGMSKKQEKDKEVTPEHIMVQFYS